MNGKLFNGLFKKGGMINRNNVTSFNACVEAYRSSLLVDTPSKFMRYFECRLVVLMR